MKENNVYIIISTIFSNCQKQQLIITPPPPPFATGGKCTTGSFFNFLSFQSGKTDLVKKELEGFAVKRGITG